MVTTLRAKRIERACTILCNNTRSNLSHTEHRITLIYPFHLSNICRVVTYLIVRLKLSMYYIVPMEKKTFWTMASDPVNKIVILLFRRDRGFCYKLVPLALTSSLEYDAYKQVCYGNVAFTYIGPSVLHFTGFLYALYLFRISDNEQLQNLMERVSCHFVVITSFTYCVLLRRKLEKLLQEM